MLIKAGVDISRLNRKIRRALNVVSSIFYEHDYEAVITSTFEGNHSPASLHYADDAFDVRHPPKYTAEITAKIRDKLGKDFDVVLEKKHIHVEYDPK